VKLLVLSPFPPRLDASHGGARAIAGLVGRLSQSHRVALLVLRGPGEDGIDAGLEQSCELVFEAERVVARRSLVHTWHERQRVPMVLTGAPGWAVGFSVRALAAQLEAVASTWRPDIVQIEFAVMGQYAGRLDRSVPLVLVEHDPADSGTSARERAAMARFRARTYARADAIVCFTERDRAAVRALAPSVETAAIPLGVEPPPLPLDPQGARPEVVFVGSFSHPPNVEAATRLAMDIFPRVLRSRPEARLLLVGPDPPSRLRALASESVSVTGRVDDLDAVLDAAAVVAAPITHGGGMRVKVLDALAAGKALVASSLAVEGLDLEPGRHAIVADGDEAFADAVAALLADRPRRAALGTAARQWVETHGGWQRVLDSYEALYESVLRRREIAGRAA
jgi:glycosyltransferase involved in cell wall biosynthesis